MRPAPGGSESKENIVNNIGKHIVKALDMLLNTVLCLAAALLLFVSGYSLLDNYYIHQQAQDPSLLAYKPSLSGQDKAALMITLDEQVAWLCIDDSYIDFPVMQGATNFDYLNKDPYGDFQLSGSIFLDCTNNPDMTDDFMMIYGHHMEHNNMFGSLDMLTDEEYFEKHKSGWIATKNGIFILDLFAVCWGKGDDWTIFIPNNRTAEDVLPYIQEHAVIYTEYEPGTQIVAMSTCAGETTSSRLIVFAMMKER